MAPRGPEVPSFSPPATASRVLFLIHASFDQARWSWSTFTLNPIGSFGPAPSSSGQIWLMGAAEAHRVATVAAGGPVQVGALETSCRRRGVSVCRREKRGEIDRLVDVSGIGATISSPGACRSRTSTTSPRPSRLTASSSSKSNAVRKSLSRVHLRQATNSFSADVGIQRSLTMTVPDLIDFQKVQRPQFLAVRARDLSLSRSMLQ
ncbi:hypothetical protein J2W39_003002 [Variovorax paradoxus]|uniref:Uncharacterized protein n=1 Tax=Variovorax paradoxus TaxID=34073 RepID=A0AAW8EFZ7_VARPD|nr:hypothetical protein [Variovorax paradoxus]